ncbi:MAG: hypothetical protein NUK57_04695, partial [Gudongella sp.]|nr:hypothetical protein [Gudongella sp.]
SGIYTGLYLGVIKLLAYDDLVAFNIGMIKNAFILTLFFISIILPMFFGLSHKLANFINVFVFVTLFQLFGMGIGTLESIFRSRIFTTAGGVLGMTAGLVLLLVSRRLSMILFLRRE